MRSVFKMDKEDKAFISHNLTTLIDSTLFNPCLEAKLVEKMVFKEDMLERIKNGSREEVGQKRNLYKDVQTRGPLAYQNLVSALAESDNLQAARILDPNQRFHQEPVLEENRNNASRMWNSPNYGDNIAPNRTNTNANMIPLEVRVRKSNPGVGAALNAIKSYKMDSTPRGHALIINNEDYINDVLPKRTGSLVDTNNLDLLFLQLGFKVTLRSNLMYSEMYREVQGFAELEDHQDADMAVVVIMSHGRHGLVAACDGREIETEWILRQFNNQGCPGLRGKPKFFIFQACRGDDMDFGAPGSSSLPSLDFDKYEGPRDNTDARSINPVIAPVYKDVSWEDMIVAYSTLPGYVANRDKYRGTWFTESLCKVFMDHAADMEIRELLDKVGETLKNFESEFGTKQSFAYEVRHFYKKLYFNP